MRIVMATFGTLGDVQPFLALGRELLRRGHEVLLGAPANFSARSEALGLAFVPLGPAADGEACRRIFAPAGELRDVNDQVQMTLPYALEHAEPSVRTLLQAAEGADVLVSIPYQAAGRIAAEVLGLPYVSAHFSPFGSSRRPKLSAIAAPGFNACRATFGLGPVADPLGADGVSSLLALTTVSPCVFPRPTTWPSHHHLTGFWFLDETPAVDPALAAFVEEGPPPVLLGFGSMTHADPDRVAAILVKAVQLAGVRAVIQSGWSGLGVTAPPKDILFAPFVPHSWLFPRASCIVHAGGAGTTAAAFRAGVPAVLVPHWLDQFMWGALAVERGLASASLPFLDLAPEALARAIRTALDEPRHQLAAAEVARAIAAEAGVRNAAELLERL